MPTEHERKLALLELLSNKRAYTVDKIFEKLPSFYGTDNRGLSAAKKMFERDKEDLAAMGFPLLVEEGEDASEAYRLDPPDPALPSDFFLTPVETEALSGVLANPLLNAQLPEPILQALWKLYELYTPMASAGAAGAPPPNAAVLSKILSAIQKERALDIEYPAKDGRLSRRQFSPWRLILKQGKSYLLAHCHRDHIPKMLSVTKMGRVASSREPYVGKPSSLDIGRYLHTQDYLPDITDGWHVKLKVDASEAWRLQNTAHHAIVKTHKNGDLEAVFGVSDPERFFGYVLTFGHHALIQEPPEAVEAFKRFLERGHQ